MNDFVYNSGDLSGHAYDSAKAYASTVLIPLTRACILLNEAIAQATADFPNRYVAEVDSSSLHEDQLVDLIGKADRAIVYYRKLWHLEYASEQPNVSLLNSLDCQIDIQQELKRKLQEKLDKLRAFHISSPKIFSSIDGLAQAVNQGMRQARTSWNSGTKIFDLPSRGELSWTKAVNQQWLDRKVSKTSFKEQVDSLTLSELEKQYGDVIRATADNVYIGSGYDGRYAGLKVSFEEANYIRSRYALLKAQGQMSLQEKEHLDTMFANLSLKDKAEIDAMSLHDITNFNISVLLPRKGLELGYAFADKEEKARIDYLYHRFEQLMAKEPIDWRDPQFMEKLNAHINETGLNPFTGKSATEHEKFIAKHYGWVKSSATMVTSSIGAFLDFSELKNTIPRPSVPLYTADDVSDVLARRGYTVDDFLHFTDTDAVLSAKQTGIVRDIRLQIGLPESGTRMVKIIPSSYVEGIVKPGSKYNKVSGFVSIDSHSSNLKTLDEVFEGNRLDYHNTPYHPAVDETYAKINFKLNHKARLDIPLSDPKADEYPFTGRGFTGSKNIVLPEFKIHKNIGYQYQAGDTITVYSSQSGDIMDQYIYDDMFKMWMKK